MNRRLGQDFDELKQSAREIPEVAEYLDSFSVAIGNLVFARRMQLGLSQMELARLARTTQATISRIESGDEGVKTGTLNSLFRALRLVRIDPIYTEDAVSSSL